MSNKSSCIILFIKAPIEGRAKTRLAESIGSSHAINIYRCFIMDILKTATQTPFQIKLFYDPPESEDHIKKWLGNEFSYYIQTGSDIGEKMANAFDTVFAEKINRAILIGSDIPDLPKQLIIDALLTLHTDNTVIGPSNDGGFYLIGFRSDSFSADIFKDIKWSTDTVYANTSKKLAELGLNTHILSHWRDIDTYADLKNLATSLIDCETTAPETSRYLKEYSSILFCDNTFR